MSVKLSRLFYSSHQGWCTEMEYITPSYRETIVCKQGHYATAAKTFIAEIKANDKMRNGAKYFCITPSQSGDRLSVVLANRKGPVLAESVVKASKVHEGVWLGLMAGEMQFVRWFDGIVVEANIANEPIALGAHQLFYTNLNEEDRAHYFEHRQSSALEVHNDCALFEEIAPKFNNTHKRNVLFMSLVLLLAGVALWLGRPEVEPVSAAPVEHALAGYQRQLNTPAPLSIFHKLQQAAWRAQTLEGWDLKEFEYSPEKGIQIEMTSPKPQLQALNDWVTTQPFDIEPGANASSIVLGWKPNIPLRENNLTIVPGQDSRLRLLDELTNLGISYREPMAHKALGYSTNPVVITFSAPQPEIWEVLKWVFGKHREATVNSVVLTHKKGYWLGTIKATLVIGGGA